MLRSESRHLGREGTSSGVPIIDFSLPFDEVGDAIHDACATIGFFVIVNHGVPEDLCAKMLDQARIFFNELSPEARQDISVARSSSYRGYQSVGVNVTGGKLDGHEALDLYSESTKADRPNPTGLANFGFNQWPDVNQLPEFRSTTERYVEEMNKLGKLLMSAASLGLGLDPSFFDPYFDDAFWSMRMIRYPPPPMQYDDYDFGVGEHTDYGVYTMILCEDIPGTLQIRARGTKDWIDVDPVPGGFICSLGDMMARWSNNIYVSTPHRVVRSEWQRENQRDRISIPFFFDPNYDALISPIDMLIGKSGRPACFEPIMYGDHLLAKTSKNFKIVSVAGTSKEFKENV